MLIIHKGDDFQLQLSIFVRQSRLALPYSGLATDDCNLLTFAKV